MKALDWLVALTRRISRVSLWVAGAMMIATALLVGAEVLLRKLGLAWVSGASEIGGYMLAICSVWAFSHTLLGRSNIRFDVVYTKCGPRTRAVLDLIGLLALGAFIFTLTYHAHAVLDTSISFGAQSTSSLAVPLWIPQSLWFAGLVFLCSTILILSLRAGFALATKDLETVTRLAGTRTAEHKFESEVEDVLAESEQPGSGGDTGR